MGSGGAPALQFRDARRDGRQTVWYRDRPGSGSPGELRVHRFSMEPHKAAAKYGRYLPHDQFLRGSGSFEVGYLSCHDGKGATEVLFWRFRAVPPGRLALLRIDVNERDSRTQFECMDAGLSTPYSKTRFIPVQDSRVLPL